MGLIDTHTHIVDDSYDKDREEVLSRAEEAGVTGIWAVSENRADAERAIELSQKYPILKPLAGLHPDNPDLEAADEVYQFIHEHHPSLLGIGEVGLDYWKVKEDKALAIQRQIFVDFITLSKTYDLPLNVHSRSAGLATIECLIENGATRVQMHAFDGKASKALVGVEAGFYFSIPASIVRDRQKLKLVKRLPLSCLLVETDSPVLAPEQRQRNEPHQVNVAVDAIAEIKQIAREAVLEAVFENTCALYNLHEK